MKKFVIFKIILIIIIALISIYVFLSIGFDIRQSKTYKLLEEYKDCYTLVYDEYAAVNSNDKFISTGIQRVLCCDDRYSYLVIFTYSEENKMLYGSKEIRENGLTSLHYKQYQYIDGELKWVDNEMSDVEIDNIDPFTGQYDYGNFFLTEYNGIKEYIKTFRRGYRFLKDKLCFYEDFSYDNSILRFIYDGDVLLRIEFINNISNQEGNVNNSKIDIYDNIALFKGRNEQIIKETDERFDNIKEK